SPLNPAAGIALASVIVFGWRMLGGVAVGALAVQLALDASRGRHEPTTTLLLAAAIAVAATLQAALGAGLVRRFVSRPLTLTVPRDIAAFLACCAISSVIATTIATIALRTAGVVGGGKVASTWGIWWVGDLAGLLIAAPVVLTLIALPRSEWAPRRLSVGLTMSLVMLLLGFGIVQATRWNEERVRTAFAHDAAHASLVLATQLEEPLDALEALRGILTVSRHPSRAELRVAAQRWLGSSEVATMGWSERVRRDDIAAFEARARAEGLTGYRVNDGADAFATPGAAGGALLRGDDVVAVRLVEPLLGNTAMLGANGLAVETTRPAIARAIDTGEPTAMSGVPVAPNDPNDRRVSITIYQAIYDGDPASMADRRAAMRGVVFVTVQMDAQLAAVAGKVPAYLRLCVVDSDPSATARRRLAGPPGCEVDRATLSHAQPLVLAGRQWELRASAEADDMPDSANKTG
ncbi:MAG TPA: CHASE domain-containing protein, partial [Caldimonas sp.]|nr:CHASE domain-containing protein [Caldimonas sp.]